MHYLFIENDHSQPTLILDSSVEDTTLKSPNINFPEKIDLNGTSIYEESYINHILKDPYN